MHQWQRKACQKKKGIGCWILFGVKRTNAAVSISTKALDRRFRPWFRCFKKDRATFCISCSRRMPFRRRQYFWKNDEPLIREWQTVRLIVRTKILSSSSGMDFLTKPSLECAYKDFQSHKEDRSVEARALHVSRKCIQHFCLFSSRQLQIIFECAKHSTKHIKLESSTLLNISVRRVVILQSVRVTWIFWIRRFVNY